jgi:hypothetical protein
VTGLTRWSASRDGEGDGRHYGIGKMAEGCFSVATGNGGVEKDQQPIIRVDVTASNGNARSALTGVNRCALQQLKA